MVIYSGSTNLWSSWLLKSIYLLTLLISTTNLLHAQTKAYIKLQIDSSEVFFGDTVVLEIESTGLLDPIDLSPLLQQATLVRETTGTRIAVFSGKVAEIKIRRMDLQPKTPGVLVIGPLMAGDITSNSVHVKVLDLVRPDWQPQGDDLQINTTVTPEVVRINQQMELTVELLHRYPVSGETISLPELSGFSKRVLISDRRTFKDDNKEWRRIEWRYLLYPRESGTLKIGSVKWTGSVLKSRAERAQFSRETKPLKVNVGVAADSQSDWWLPSDSVTLSEVWSEPPTSLRAGDELNRVITIEAGEVLSGQIPTPVILESRALQQTLIDTNRSEQITDNNIVSKAVFTYRVKAQSPIPVFMDTVRLKWWNTNTFEAQEAIIPARRINVGLPDRADLLSKAALQETGVNRLNHLLQTANWLRPVLYCLALIAVVFTLWNVTPQLRARYRKQQQINRCIAELKTAARNGNEKVIYNLLRRSQSRQVLGGTETELVRALESRLYSRSGAPPRVLQLMPMINSIERKVKCKSFGIKSNSKSELAEI